MKSPQREALTLLRDEVSLCLARIEKLVTSDKPAIDTNELKEIAIALGRASARIMGVGLNVDTKR